MKCRNPKCNHNFDVNSDTSAVVEFEEQLDVQISCPKCDELHYTFVPIAELSDDRKS